MTLCVSPWNRLIFITNTFRRILFFVSCRLKSAFCSIEFHFRDKTDTMLIKVNDAMKFEIFGINSVEPVECFSINFDWLENNKCWNNHCIEAGSSSAKRKPTCKSSFQNRARAKIFPHSIRRVFRWKWKRLFQRQRHLGATKTALRKCEEKKKCFHFTTFYEALVLLLIR